jgi:hypothetical protein
MTEIKTAKKLLADRVGRFETIGIDNGGTALTAHWVDGGQKLFYTLEEVAGFIQERESAAQSR